MLAVYDFEDGLQPILTYALDVETKIRFWDRKGFFSEVDSFEEKNIIIMSKPYDCLQRGVLRGKYNESDERAMKDWSRRNWRYSTSEIYEHINNIIEKMDSYIVIHPDDFSSGNIKSKIKNYLNIDLKVTENKLKEIYSENVNIK